ncbi:MAG: hypothetical protein KIT35_22035 [Piscinibacter sp.]|uniref:hypothetical protein n=1 Tax=Piscinibacter sp. TaxID=1903157 RepID=UPI00258A0773|nr:hypothetical protein [Piscinibacter sp.]MCW5666521.1 hypothetical protein [Piscinibacter sp.]
MSRICCNACSGRLDFEVMIPSEVWELIARGRYALCPRCIDEECAALGLREVPCVAVYVGAALRSVHTETHMLAIRAWRPGQECVDRGTVGNPMLYPVPGGVFEPGPNERH